MQIEVIGEGLSLNSVFTGLLNPVDITLDELLKELEDAFKEVSERELAVSFKEDLKINLYFAAPLFSQADLIYNEIVFESIMELGNFTGYLPQANGDINDKNAYASSIDILEGDLEHVDNCDIMVALIDGASIDAGVAAEIGYAYANGIPIYGLYTDSRQLGATNKDKIEALKDIGENQFDYRNLFVTGMIKDSGGQLVGSLEDLLDVLSFLD